MKILLYSTSFNSLTQQAFVALGRLGHELGVALAVNDQELPAAIRDFNPDLILCPMLTKIIPAEIWERIPCLVCHPGIPGDRGSASLDWAIFNGETEWGVTVLQAADQVDGGAIWASGLFPMRECSKSSLYRNEVATAAVRAMVQAVTRFEQGHFAPLPLDYGDAQVRGRFRWALKQKARQINWHRDSVSDILRKINSADSNPGLLCDIEGEDYYLYGAHREGSLFGRPGSMLATRHGAVCFAASDGAVWITHMKKKARGCFKLPATMVLGALAEDLPVAPIGLPKSKTATFQDIYYEEKDGVGTVHFSFYNGAMASDQCVRLTEAVKVAAGRPTQVLVLRSGRDFWSNGIHLNVIEAAEDPAEESWRNINAINDLVQAIYAVENQITIAAMQGSAGAGGVMLALAADFVFVRDGLILNPHYKSMGHLYGSEYWTYSLPRRVGAEMARALTENCLPVGVNEALRMGLVDQVIQEDAACGSFAKQVARTAGNMARDPATIGLLTDKWARREEDEQTKPLERYRAEELAQMKINFFGDDPAYHEARSNFVHKREAPSTPAHLSGVFTSCRPAPAPESLKLTLGDCAWRS